MAYDFCKITICGRLATDPRRSEVSGKTVLNCRVAASVGFGDKQSTNFVSFSLWDKIADAMADKLRKGDRVLIHGDLETEEYETKGEKRTGLKLRFTEQFLLLEDTRERGDTGERGRDDGRNEFGGREDFNPPRGQQSSGRGGFPGRR